MSFTFSTHTSKYISNQVTPTFGATTHKDSYPMVTHRVTKSQITRRITFLVYMGALDGGGGPNVTCGF